MDITVITPFYKGNGYMEQLLTCISRAAARVSDAQVEMLLVNDSPDVEISYDPAWVQNFSLRILCNAQNSGIHRSRVNGLKQAQGRFIQFLDQDDLLAEETFATQLPLMEGTDVVIANGFDQNPRTYGPIYKSLTHQQQATQARFYYSVGNQIVSPGHCLIRREAIPEAWCTTYITRNGSDDLLLWLLMFAEGRRFTVNALQLYTHVDTGANVSADEKKILNSSAEVVEILKANNAITPLQERKYLRCRRMGAMYANKSRGWALLAMVCYPDVAWEKLMLRRNFYR